MAAIGENRSGGAIGARNAVAVMVSRAVRAGTLLKRELAKSFSVFELRTRTN
jgi:hypothetical protein